MAAATAVLTLVQLLLLILSLPFGPPLYVCMYVCARAENFLRYKKIKNTQKRVRLLVYHPPRQFRIGLLATYFTLNYLPMVRCTTMQSCVF